MSVRRLLLHFLVGVAVVGMITAGLWQLNRLSERKEFNQTVADQGQSPVVELRSLVDTADSYEQGEEIEFRVVRSTGIYRPEDQVLIRNRTYQGAPGFWVLTPLEVEPGVVVAVNRGWIPHALGDSGSPAEFAPPAGSVTVTGLVRITVTAEGIQQADPSSGVLVEMARPDLARLQQQLNADLLTVYVQLQDQVPVAASLPAPVPPPERGDGPHLAYAVQWFIFATITIVGYPLILRRQGSTEGRESKTGSGSGRFLSREADKAAE